MGLGIPPFEEHSSMPKPLILSGLEDVHVGIYQFHSFTYRSAANPVVDSVCFTCSIWNLRVYFPRRAQDCSKVKFAAIYSSFPLQKTWTSSSCLPGCRILLLLVLISIPFLRSSSNHCHSLLELLRGVGDQGNVVRKLKELYHYWLEVSSSQNVLTVRLLQIDANSCMNNTNSRGLRLSPCLTSWLR